MANSRVEEEKSAFFERARQVRQAIASGAHWVEEHMHHDTPEARAKAEKEHQERMEKAEAEREADRKAFQLRALRDLGHVYGDILDRKGNGEGDVYEPGEIVGEIPYLDIPAQVHIDKNELNPPSPRFLAIREGIRKSNEEVKGAWEDHRGIFILGMVAGTGALILGLGARKHFKHILRDNPEADIT